MAGGVRFRAEYSVAEAERETPRRPALPGIRDAQDEGSLLPIQFQKPFASDLSKSLCSIPKPNAPVSR
jgi:hypothetical protein